MQRETSRLAECGAAMAIPDWRELLKIGSPMIERMHNAILPPAGRYLSH